MNKETINKIAIECPLFPGFYNTILSEGYFDHDSECDHYKELGLIPQDIDNSDIDFSFDYDQYMLDVSSKYVDLVNEFLSENNLASNVEFVKLVSPKFYNYSTDKIIIKGTFNIPVIIKVINNNLENFKNFLKDNYTSYDGFISFIANNSNEFLSELLTGKPEYLTAALIFAMNALYQGNESLQFDLSIGSIDDIHLSLYLNKCEYRLNGEWVAVN